MTQHDEEFKDKAEGAALIAGGTAAGAGIAATVGGMGLAVSSAQRQLQVRFLWSWCQASSARG
jgi:hypothetical protein